MDELFVKSPTSSRISIAYWNTTVGNARVDLYKLPNASYECLGNYANHRFGGIYSDKDAIAHVQDLIDSGKFDAPSPVWKRVY